MSIFSSSTEMFTRLTKNCRRRKRSRSKRTGSFSLGRTTTPGNFAPRAIDLHGYSVVPGLTDSHCHIFGIGERELTLNLEGTNTLEDFLAKVKARGAQTPRDKWITGRGWIETFWKPPRFPTRPDLASVVADHALF